nr:aryl-alcohol dehydrogenase [Quercus suber]
MTEAVTTEAYVARPCATTNNANEGPVPNIRLEHITYNPLGPNELFVQIAAASVCHTDIKTATGQFHIQPPVVLGHEASGIVTAVGRAVTYVVPGDRVILSYAACLQCRRCLRGQQPYCEKIFPLNFSGQREDGTTSVQGEGDVKGLFFGQSSLSRIAVVRESCAVKVDSSVTEQDLRVCASLGCGVQTGAGAIMNVAKPPVGSCIVVFGGGAVGLSAILAAKLTSPASLVLVENSQAKLDMLPKAVLQGVQVINSSKLSQDEIATNLKELTPSGMGMDYALDCVGNEQIILAAHASLDKLGTLLVVGSSAEARLGILTGQHLVKGANIRGTHNGDSVPRIMIPYLISLWRSGKFPFDMLLTHFRFEELEKAMEQVRKGEVIKPLLVL